MDDTLECRHQGTRPLDPSAELYRFKPMDQPKGILTNRRRNHLYKSGFRPHPNQEEGRQTGET